ncbi:GNAT family N-acetyltransferase [Nocardioides sp. TRM66260-LWL]|uniref:GNAT family N-acetyltransferase n=1 Tax=Nocardioides sp. TRM66260-LWL TaxID=2874478 RepID=UPI001CC35D0A|nr:GNAT family N-acetyltransferase [Nocardioides sp. TRM66260-LWL]MBZ5734289.1 GNAT family N-acetyltransferase [Nocardioides sp. TRM66260-LWL]
MSPADALTPPGEPRVRRVRPDDHAAVGALIVAAYEPHLLGPDDPYRARLADVARRDAEAEVWVAEDADGAPLGSVTLCLPGSPWREAAHEHEGEFRMLAVAPSAQGRGVARRLVTAVLDRCAAEGLSGVVLSTLAQQRAAHRLYASLGFVRAPQRDHSPAPGVDLLVMVRSIPA